MIALDRSEGARGLLTEESSAFEAYEELLRYRGRVLRVQESAVAELTVQLGKRSEQAELNYEYRTLTDRVGVLSSIRLSYSGDFYPQGENPSKDLSFLRISLDGDVLQSLELQRAQIQVLQEDNGSWETLLRGTEWREFNTDYLRIYGK